MSKTLQQRLVVENPQSAKEAWDILADIFHDNKRIRFIALKAELRSLKLGDLTMDAYFRKIESIVTVLTSLGSPVYSDDVVTFALEGLPAKYDNVSTLQQKPLSPARFSPATYVAGEKSLNDKNTPTWHFFSLNL
ncbi:hybrid signal transduction histidine kinase M [Tanacetum coccineum]|uniref:Hybrid signal transduction histidine kinase M n=1 Tax=Tanacetum coccineum TaxID=301880 RepID=A0ABQ5JBC4_9ASTR